MSATYIPIKIDQSAVTLIGATIVFLFEKTEIRLEGHRHVLARRMSTCERLSNWQPSLRVI